MSDTKITTGWYTFGYAGRFEERHELCLENLQNARAHLGGGASLCGERREESNDSRCAGR